MRNTYRIVIKSFTMRSLVLIISLGLIVLACGCSSPTPSTTVPITSAPSMMPTHMFTYAPTSVAPISPTSVQAAIDAAKIASRNNLASVTATMDAGTVDVTFTETAVRDKAALKQVFLKTSYETMTALVAQPGIQIIRIKGYAPKVDSQGNPQTILMFSASIIDMEKAKKVNWPNLASISEASAIKNFDSVNGPVMEN